MKHTLLLLAGVLLFTGLSGCTQSILGSPLVGTWETKVLGFTQTLQFESNNTGVLVTTLGQKAFEYQVLDDHTVRYREVGEEDWDEKTYQLVNANTLILDEFTWVRKGSV
mgnify:CR=1 FL=1